MTKSEARQKGKEYRKSLDAFEKKERDNAVLRAFFSLDEVENADKVCVYISIRDEVDTFGIIDALLRQGKTLSAPVVTGENMVAKSFSSLSELKTGAFGIPEPQGETVDICDFDIIVVPMVAFNSKLDRVGYGKGYYDRFLPEGVMTVGLAYAGQRADFVPDAFDKALDVIITDEGVVR